MTIKQRIEVIDGVTNIILEPGRDVVCDDCNADYTDRKDPGGILVQSKALCPVCAPKWLKLLAEYNEEHFIRGRCPDGMAFADWVRDIVR